MNDESGFNKFLQWEITTRDTIDFKKTYVDMTGDLIAGLLLSQIVFWHLPTKQGRTKLRVKKDGHLWIAKQRDDWWDEVRIRPKRFDRACDILVKKGIIVKAYYRFNGLRMMHLRIDHSVFMELWEQGVSPQLPKGADRPSPTVNPLTESTTEINTEKKTPSLSPRDEEQLWPSHSNFSPREETTEEKPITTTDPLTLAAECASRSEGKKSWTVTADAGGADPYQDGPLKAACAILRIDPDSLAEEEKHTWARQLKRITKAVKGGTPRLFVEACKAWSSAYEWKGKSGAPYSNVFRGAFPDDLQMLMRQVKSGTVTTSEVRISN